MDLPAVRICSRREPIPGATHLGATTSTWFFTMMLVCVCTSLQREDYMAWVFLHNGSPFTVCESREEIGTPTTTNSPATAIQVAPADEPKHAVIDEPKAVLKIAPEPEPAMPDQGCEPSSSPVPKFKFIYRIVLTYAFK